MPTQHVKPDSHETLQDVANALLKARKIVIVTGAGISTNSGIPDFRSENGLYSLIQAQFEAATLHGRRPGAAPAAKSDDELFNDDERPVKRRKVSRETSPIHADRDDPTPEKKDEKKDEEDEDEEQQQKEQRDQVEDAPADPGQHDPSAAAPDAPDAPDQPSVLSTPRPRKLDPEYGMPPTTSPLSSPPCGDFMIPPSLQEHQHTGALSFAAHAHKHKRLTDVSRAVDSSPLSSPPPILFDPFQLGSPAGSRGSMSRRSSTTVSEADESLSSSNNSSNNSSSNIINNNNRNHGSTSSSSDPNTSAVEEEGDAGVANNASSSQSSNPGRINLPNMKGKDLFDASIWADPTRTSVFYRFATSLRQRVREAEPTSSHKFISHLRDRGKLVRCYTQNIDQIEEKVGLSTSLHEGPGSRGRFSRKTATASAGQANKAEESGSGAGAGADAGDATPPERPGNEAGQSQSSQPAADPAEGSPGVAPAPSQTKLEEESAPCAAADAGQNDQGKPPPPPLKREPSHSGVECVFLHGSLELLRCFQCGRVCSWDDQDRELETLSGQQPECPHCVGATEARREKGKRALGVGKLRPDIVLYGEEHPDAHLISPIVTHDLALCPDMLLILGTSLRVHGLKIMVREFAKAVHNRGGNVVFVNFTKPPESSWGDVIDYWIQWDCDAWVADLRARIPKLWQAPEPPRPKKKQQRESGGVVGSGSPPDQQQQQQQQHEGDKKGRPPATNPVALRDTKFTGAYCTLKILKELHRITHHPPLLGLDPTPTAGAAPPPPPPPPSPPVTASASTPATPTLLPPPLRPLPPPSKQPTVHQSALLQGESAAAAAVAAAAAAETRIREVAMEGKPRNAPKTPRSKRPRRPAAGPEKPKRTSSTLNPNHGRSRRQDPIVAAATSTENEAPPSANPAPAPAPPEEMSSILFSVKSNPRIRKRKMIDGEEVAAPTVGKRRSIAQAKNAAATPPGTGYKPTKAELKLPPLRPERVAEPAPAPAFGRPQPLEPPGPPDGPLAMLSVNMRAAMTFSRPETFYLEDPLVKLSPQWPVPNKRIEHSLQQQQQHQQVQLQQEQQQVQQRQGDAHREEAEADAALALAGLKTGSPVVSRVAVAASLEGDLKSWGASWSCNRR